jgi:hypothetical protein
MEILFMMTIIVTLSVMGLITRHVYLRVQTGHRLAAVYEQVRLRDSQLIP